jgi:signal transduction histidine kinase/DNA-binding response OmpR family regulator
MSSVLGRNLIGRALIVSGIGSLLIGVTGFTIFNRQVSAIATEEIAAASARARAVTNRNLQEMVFSVSDWANWDDAYAFMLGGAAGFEQREVSDTMLRKINVDEIAFIRSDGQTLFKRTMNPASAKQPIWQEFKARPDLLRRVLAERKAISGFVKLHGMMHVVAMSPIFRSDGQGSPRGVLMMGREVEPRELGAALDLPVAFGVQHSAATQISRGTAEVTIPLPALLGNPPTDLTMTVDLPITQSAQLARLLGPAALILINLLIAFAILRQFDKLVTRRVLALEDQVGKLAGSGYINRLTEDPLDDEISSLTKRINALFSELDLMNAEERRLKLEALEAADAAQRAERAKADFVAVISHEIRTPLAVVLGGIELMLTQKLPKTAIDMLNRLDKAGERLKALIDDVLDFSRIEHEGVATQLHPVDLVQVLAGLVEGYQITAQAKQLTLRFESDAERAPVMADAFRIQQVLSNLLSNAVKFTPHGTIDVSLEHRGNKWWRIEVADTGIGLDAGQVDNLFTPFTQADQTTVRRFGGTGLGLSICRRIVQAMGGKIGVTSALGQGSTFWFELPLTAADPATLTQPKVRSKPARPEHPLTLLLVDDNQLVLDMLRDQVKALGHRPTCVTNGLAAFNAVASQPFDAMLIDMHMPIMDGMTAARAIRELDAGAAQGRGAIPILAVTADADISRRTQFQDIDFEAFLTKPCDAATLNGALANVVPAAPRTGRPAEPHQTPVLSTEMIIETERTVGTKVLTRHLTRFASELDPAIDSVIQLLQSAEPERAAAQAHKLKGAALLVGANQLQTVLNRIEHPAASFDAAAETSLLRQVAADTQIALSAVINSLAAATPSPRNRGSE